MKKPAALLGYHLPLIAVLAEHGVAARFWRRVDRSAGPDSCWPYRRTRTYGTVTLRSEDGRKITARAHRVAYVLSVGEDVPEGLFVCHRCDFPPCCNPKHLFVGTAQDNTNDSIRKGRHFSTRIRRNPEAAVR